MMARPMMIRRYSRARRSVAIVPFSPIAWTRTSRAKRQTGHHGRHRSSYQGFCFHEEVCRSRSRHQGGRPEAFVENRSTILTCQYVYNIV
jgi:hypothetical protein